MIREGVKKPAKWRRIANVRESTHFEWTVLTVSVASHSAQRVFVRNKQDRNREMGGESRITQKSRVHSVSDV